MATADLSNLMFKPGPDAYYSDTMRNALEDNLVNMRIDPQIGTSSIAPDQGIANMYDFYGVCLALGLPPELHWITMRLNGYLMSADYLGDVTVFLVPTTGMISKYKQILSTSTILS